jgi:hypothetical protein
MSGQLPQETLRVVAPLDTRGRRLLEPDDRTPRDQDLLATIPDPVDLGSLIDRPTGRTPAIDKAALMRAPHPLDLAEAPTRPDAPAASDVFAPVRGEGRAIAIEAPTPLERPDRHEVPTAIEKRTPLRAETITMKPVARDERTPSRHAERERSEAETNRERNLVAGVIHSERGFVAMKSVDPPRAAHVEALAGKLRESGVFAERNLALVVHAREKAALAQAPHAEQKTREDRVFALALLAREADDAYRAQTRALTAHLVADARVLTPEKREQVFADFDSFMNSESANDSAHCRRELHKALREEHEWHRAYVYALALDRGAGPRRVQADAKTLLAGLDAAAAERSRA